MGPARATGAVSKGTTGCLMIVIWPPQHESLMELFSESGRKCRSAGAGNQDPFTANRGFRAQAGCQRGRSRTQASYGHPEATLKLSGGQPVGTLKPPRGYLEATLKPPSGYPRGRGHCERPDASELAAESERIQRISFALRDFGVEDARRLEGARSLLGGQIGIPGSEWVCSLECMGVRRQISRYSCTSASSYPGS